MSRFARRGVTRTLAPAAAAALILGVVPALAGPAIVNAAPAQSSLDLCDETNADRCENIKVWSESMQRHITVQVLKPADTSTPAPVLYLLNGAGGGEDSATWAAQTSAMEFFDDKDVYVVTPLEGAFSYYTDWNEPDESLAEALDNNGVYKFETFLTEELPAAIEGGVVSEGQSQAYSTNGKRSLAGISMAGSSVLDLAIQADGTGTDGGSFYDSVGAYSGCAMTSDPAGATAVDIVMAMGGADSTNMWGPRGSQDWVDHDVYVNADKLPDVPMFVSSGSGLPGHHDTMENWRVDSDAVLANQIIVGGGIEAVTSACTNMLKLKTDGMGMDNIHYDLKPAGSHSWGYWEDDLHNSWPMLSAPLY